MSLLAKLEEVKGQSFADKLRGNHAPMALLCDCSGSMCGILPSGRNMWQTVCDQVRALDVTNVFSFHSDFIEGLAQGPMGGTDMAKAFKEMRRLGLTSFLLITDGLPDDERSALDAAQGLTIEIIYVGPDPRPRFLDALASRCRGRARSVSLGQTQALPEAMKALGMGKKD